MDFLKIQLQILKDASARDDYRHKKFSWLYSITEDTILISNGYFVVIIPRSLFYLDVEKTFNKAPYRLENIIKDEPGYDCYQLHETKEIYDNKKIRILEVFKCNNNFIYVDREQLKYFNLNECTFKGTDRKTPIFIYSEEILVGVVLPVNYKED